MPIIARDNDCIFATEDNRLKTFSENNGVEELRTLKIIKLMEQYNIISCRKAIETCYLLKNCPFTRIPEADIKSLIEKLEKDQVTI